jgi:hypothetical protein
MIKGVESKPMGARFLETCQVTSTGVPGIKRGVLGFGRRLAISRESRKVLFEKKSCSEKLTGWLRGRVISL